jgi:hypothetical protein
MQTDLTKLDLVSLRNLFFEETREFLSALDTETFDVLEFRRERIREIDRQIESRKKLIEKNPALDRFISGA